jgi:hypothetical protein
LGERGSVANNTKNMERADAGGTYRGGDVGGTHVANILDATLGASYGGFLFDEAHCAA